MSGVYQTRVNQKLYFARLHLEALEKAEQGTGWSKHALIESYNESVLFHLACAYNGFLREVAEQYRLDVDKVQTLSDLAALAEHDGLEAPELGMLQQLEADPGSWLNQMVHAYEACWKASEVRTQPSEQASLSEIHVVQINPDHAEDQEIIRQLAGWLDQCRSLVEQLREGMKEW